MKERLLKESKKGIVILLFGILYYVVFASLDIAIPCIFNKVTGYLCPSCGITRMIDAMVHFNFNEAFSYNKLLFLIWPWIFGVLLAEEIDYIVTGARKIKLFTKIVLSASILLLVAFGIIRNLI